jgi:NADPH-dependent curcumin reductase CurA
MVNHQFRLGRRPEGSLVASDLRYSEGPIRPPGPGQLLVQVLYLSVDPGVRGWLNPARTYIAPVEIGDVMRAIGVGKVVEANGHNRFSPGDYVMGMLGTQEVCTTDGEDLVRVDPALAPLPTYLGRLGLPGLTAYVAVTDLGRPARGETFVVSAAAGAVGSAAGQLARLRDCRVVGIVGGYEKCRYVTEELGFDAAIDYKSEDVSSGLGRECPDGVNVYLDNVGGEILDAVLERLARGARVVISGAVSQYNATGPWRGPSNYMSLLVNRASMVGFVVWDHLARYESFVAEMAPLIRNGSVRSREQIVDGLAELPNAVATLFAGDYLGKLVLRIAGDE